MSPKEVKIVPSEEEVIKTLCELIQDIARTAIQRDDVFKVGLSGGSLTKFLTVGLPKIETDWAKWRLFFCDERVVPVESADSTYGVYKSSLIGTVPLTEEQFIKIDPHLNTAEEAAKDYIQKMAVHFPPDSLPRFHLLLLGMGPDGHTCSLFPDHRLLEETSVWVAPITNSPKPPASRITLTFPVVNNAECCIFALTGAGKADIVKRVLKDEEPLPAARVKPTDGKLYWILDNSAAAHITDM
ncbi:LOW QUALITY PROTEIN: 6-phosphogluconolactonase-like [Schistocerca serialis cubense]|uniref:LOW QUALITY PROTEIN: 6-phosphogluconolactonase-like n=1 Tax=Schistocerca serialis cubense TaxID=2023355 RepID=UPI00214E936E|nr:LOW QUALITY PROTEIN: 6-phosphogluconolactonase-like [Schistocerca serialis cubense]